MAPTTREGAPKSAPDLLPGEIVNTISKIGPETQPVPAPRLPEFEAQKLVLAARLRMSEAAAGVVLSLLRERRQ